MAPQTPPPQSPNPHLFPDFPGSPRAPSGAQRPGCRGGSRYVEGCQGFPYLKSFLVSWFLGFWFLGFLVSWLLGFLVYWCLGVLVLWFCGFMVYGFMVLWFCFFVILWFYGFIVLWFCDFMVFKNYKISIPCVQEGIHPISKVSKILLDGSSGFAAPAFSQIDKHIGFPTFQNYKNIFQK